MCAGPSNSTRRRDCPSFIPGSWPADVANNLPQCTPARTANVDVLICYHFSQGLDRLRPDLAGTEQPLRSFLVILALELGNQFIHRFCLRGTGCLCGQRDMVIYEKLVYY